MFGFFSVPEQQHVGKGSQMVPNSGAAFMNEPPGTLALLMQ